MTKTKFASQRASGRVALAVVLAMVAVPAAAQIPPPAALQQVPPGSPLPRVLPTPPPPVAVPTLPPSPPPAAIAPGLTVRVAAVAVEGVTAYPVAKIAALAQGLVGPAVPVAKIEAARQAILQRYRRDGYVLSTVAANIDADGRLRFVVTEGHIASVKLSRSIGPAGVQVLRFLKRLTEKTPIDEATLERYLLLAQSVPGVTLHAVLQPSTEEPGALNLVADVSRAPISGLITTDNYASSFTGPIESLLVTNFNSFTQFGEQTQVSLYHTWPDSQTFGQASSEMFVGSSGLKVRLYAGDGQAYPTGTLGAVHYRGITTVFGGALEYPVIKTRQQSLDVTGNFDAIDTSIRESSGLADDALRIVRTSANYARSDLWLGDGRSAVNALSVRISQGLPGLGATENGSATAPRPGERIDFFKFDGQLSRTQVLFSPTPNSTVSLLGLLTGQISPDVLPPAEQFYLGGLQINRGYYSGEVSGDKALASTIELQLDTSFDLTRFGIAERLPVQFYGFYDWGEVWQNSKQSLQVHINSTGGGARFSFTRYAEFDMLGVVRLNRFPTGTGQNIQPIVPGEVLWRLLARF